MEKVSVVFLSWKRPNNVRQILDSYSQYESIDEVIVWNNNKNIFLNYQHPRVKIVNTNVDFSLSSKFMACSLAVNDTIIMQDDDILVSEQNMLDMTSRLQSGDLITYEGRMITDTGEYSYCDAYRISKVEEDTIVDVTLTRCVCFEKRIVPYVITAHVQLMNSKPIDNGEDIFLGYCIRSRGGKIITIPILDKDGYVTLEEPHKISERPNHIQVRTDMTRFCNEAFKEKIII